MHSGRPPSEGQYPKYYNVNNYYFTDATNPGQYVPPGMTNQPKPEPEPESDDEPSELQPQYNLLPQSTHFISAQPVRNHYTEIQVGIHSQYGGPDPPACDNCRSMRKDGKCPIVYICQECVRYQDRPLCKRCARKEFSNEAGLHKPDHRVRKWEPTWAYAFASGIHGPLLSPEMEQFVQDQLTDDLRKLTFQSREYFDDRTIRFFLPAPGGLCRVVIQVQVEPIRSTKKPKDIVDKARGMFKHSSASEIIGTIGASAFPFVLAPPPIPARSEVQDEPEDPKKQDRFGSTKSIDIRRGDDFRRPYVLDVYVNIGSDEHNGIELVLQDEYYESDEYQDRPFRWVLKKISITHIAPLAASFASIAQMEQYHRKQAQTQREEQQERQKSMQEKYQAQKEEREKRQQEFQDRQQQYRDEWEQRQREEREAREKRQAESQQRQQEMKDRHDMERHQQEERAQQQQQRRDEQARKQKQRWDEQRIQAEEKRQARKQERQQQWQSKSGSRPTSMPPNAYANITLPQYGQQNKQGGHPLNTHPPLSFNPKPVQPPPPLVKPTPISHGFAAPPVGQGSRRSYLAPTDAATGLGRSKSGRSISPNWRTGDASRSRSRSGGSSTSGRRK